VVGSSFPATQAISRLLEVQPTSAQLKLANVHYNLFYTMRPEGSSQEPLLREAHVTQKKSSRKTRAAWTLLLIAGIVVLGYASVTKTPLSQSNESGGGTFTIAHDKFVKDGIPLQLISGR